MKVKHLIELLRTYDKEMQVLYLENLGDNFLVESPEFLHLSEEDIRIKLHEFGDGTLCNVLIIGDY